MYRNYWIFIQLEASHIADLSYEELRKLGVPTVGECITLKRKCKKEDRDGKWEYSHIVGLLIKPRISVFVNFHIFAFHSSSGPNTPLVRILS